MAFFFSKLRYCLAYLNGLISDTWIKDTKYNVEWAQDLDINVNQNL